MYMHVTDLSGEQVKWNKFPKFWGFVFSDSYATNSNHKSISLKSEFIRQL